MTSRRYDLDWLRVIAVFLLVPFHSALIFIHDPNVVMYVKDEASSSALNYFAGWLHQFHMPLLFYIAGAATFFSLQKRRAGQYVRERFLKLLIPAVAGIVLIIPPITYIALLSNGESVGFWQHFVDFWQFKGANLGGLDGKFTPAHLWFLLYLFVFSLIGLPFFTLFKQDKVIGKCGKGWAWVIFITVFIILAASAMLNLLGDKNPVYYFLVFFAGYLFMMNGNIQDIIHKCAPWFLLVAIFCTMVSQYSLIHIENGTLSFLVGQLTRWTWLLCVLGFGHRCLKNGNNPLKYLSGASYPFYIFHLLFNTIIGYYIIRLPLSVGLKYSIIVILTITVTMLFYEIVKRIPGVRFLFGITKR